LHRWIFIKSNDIYSSLFWNCRCGKLSRH
jgi:hypothetical protein